jgi:hypothetical protein
LLCASFAGGVGDGIGGLVLLREDGERGEGGESEKSGEPQECYGTHVK